MKISVLLALALLIPALSHARVIPDAGSGSVYNRGVTNDLWCTGGRYVNGSIKSATEVCDDWTGSLVPTSTTGVQAIGSSTEPWNSMYVGNASLTPSGGFVAPSSATLGTAGTVGATGYGGNSATYQTTNGLSVLGQVSITGIVSSTSIPVSSSFETLMSTSNGAVDITALPSISTSTVPGGNVQIPSGTYLVLTSTGPSGVVLYDNGTLSGSRLKLGSTTRTITSENTLTLIYSALDNFWREAAFGNP